MSDSNDLSMLPTKVGYIIKITGEGHKHPHYILIGAISSAVSPVGYQDTLDIDQKEYYVYAMDSNDYYRADRWLKSEFSWEFLTITQAVAEGWRPFSVSLFRSRDAYSRSWNEYVEAMKTVPYEQLFEEAIACITKRSSWGD